MAACARRGQALILYKIALDRFLYGPAFNLVMMSFVFRVSGQSWPQMVKSLRASFWDAQVLARFPSGGHEALSQPDALSLR